MNYYALQVKTSGEGDFLARAERLLAGQEYHFFFPKRALTIKRMRKSINVQIPVFPGYLFMACKEDPGPICFMVRKLEGFYRFLPDNHSMKPLSGRDLLMLKHFMSFGEIADKSKVSFDENDRIVVHSGPLKGYEGCIIKVDKRKGRAKLQLTLCENPFVIDLGFELLEKLPKGADATDGRVEPDKNIHNRSGIRGDDPVPGDRA
jgi:transcriptional antiterminator NusG